MTEPTKHCYRCKTTKPISEYYKASKKSRAKYGIYAYCKRCHLDWQREYKSKKRKNPEWLAQERKRANAVNKRAAQRLRAEVLLAYGNKCNCCDERDAHFLTIDHIFEDGAEHRAGLGIYRGKGAAADFYRWLRNNNFPKDRYQLLCWNCNLAKHHYGLCPHKGTPPGKRAKGRVS